MNATRAPSWSPTGAPPDYYRSGTLYVEADLALAFVYIVLIGVGLFANIFILAMMARFRRFFTINAFTILAFTLCISDGTMVILSGIPNVISLLQRRAVINSVVCNVSGWMLNFNLRINSFLTTCICLVRCIVVVWPIKSRFLLSKKMLYSCVTVSVTLAVVCSSLPFIIPKHLYKVYPNYYHFNPFVGYCVFYLPQVEWMKYITMVLIEGVFFIPFIVAICTCTALVVTLRKRRAYIGISCSKDNQNIAIIAILRVTMLTLICCTPLFVCTMISKFANREVPPAWYNITVITYINYGISSQMMMYLRTAINPFLIGMPTYITNARNTSVQRSRKRTTLRSKSIKRNGVPKVPLAKIDSLAYVSQQSIVSISNGYDKHEDDRMLARDSSKARLQETAVTTA